MIVKVLKGLGVTLLITLSAFVLGILIGMLISLIQGVKSNKLIFKVLKKIANIYVSIFRGTPVTVQLLIIYYVVFTNIQPLIAAIVAFGLNSGAYVSEIIRGGINSIPKGQMEAGRSLGLSYPTVMKKIILPQAIRNCLPSLGNEFVALIKETSVVSFITVIDLYSAFRALATASFNYKGIYLIMGVVYFVIIFIFTYLIKLLEKKVFKNVNAK
jgi:polar amino acid transport system permease protein